MTQLANRILTAAASIGLLVGLVGCGADTPPTNPADQGPTAKGALEDLANLLKATAEEKKRPPAKTTDLEPYEGAFLSATLGIHQKRIVYIWGASLSGGSSVVAYDANAESAGGYVLLQDGTVKEMTAAEFKAAPKAGKK
jgi:hypothetical protein